MALPLLQAARLQTQTITMPAPPPRDLSLSLASLPPRVEAEQPIALELSIKNSTDRRLGPLRLGFEGSGAAAPPSPAEGECAAGAGPGERGLVCTLVRLQA